jgi:cytidylate kinase
MTREATDLHFDLNSHVLRALERRKLDQIANALQDMLHKSQELIIVIEGPSDDRGVREYNQELGLQRADAVRRVLLNRSFPEDRVRALSFGDRTPVCPNARRCVPPEEPACLFQRYADNAGRGSKEVEMFKVVTVAREYGSGGGIIARAVAEKLRWSLLDRALIRVVARTAQVDEGTAERYNEHVESWWHRFHRAGLWSAAIMAGIPPRDVRFFDADSMAEFARQVMLKAAERGDCVIVGRGAQCALQDREDVLHVFIGAPRAGRVARVGAGTQSSQDIEESIRVANEGRASYIRTYYGCDWKDPHLYHMMIGSQIGTDMASWMIVNAVKGAGQP